MGLLWTGFGILQKNLNQVTEIPLFAMKANTATPCQTIDLHGVQVVVKREDLNHPIVQGNKLRKLKYNLIEAKNQQKHHLLTFGGAYSNHLLATAFAAKKCGFKATGIVRGNELAYNQAVWSETLFRCQRLGMNLLFVSRADYRLKEQAEVVKSQLAHIDRSFVLPEGGTNALAIKGVAEIVAEIEQQTKTPTHIFCPVGTGGTLAGLVQGVAEQQWLCQVFGVSVLQGLQSVKDEVKQWFKDMKNPPTWKILDDFHCGGYAKTTPELVRFGITFEQQHGFSLDKIYNNKSFYALAQLIKSGQITNADRPLIIHTGGLQGGVNT